MTIYPEKGPRDNFVKHRKRPTEAGLFVLGASPAGSLLANDHHGMAVDELEE
jgi:hypothetical protein